MSISQFYVHYFKYCYIYGWLAIYGDIMAEKEEKGGMSVKEAGKKGGEKTAETHGKEFYKEIGHKGGEKTSDTHGQEFYEEIGHKGGEKGGPKGGQRVKELVEEGKESESKGK